MVTPWSFSLSALRALRLTQDDTVAYFGLVTRNTSLVAKGTSVQNVTLPRPLVPYTQLQYRELSPVMVINMCVNTSHSTPTSSTDSANHRQNALIASMLGFATVLGVIDAFWGCYNREAYHTEDHTAWSWDLSFVRGMECD